MYSSTWTSSCRRLAARAPSSAARARPRPPPSGGAPPRARRAPPLLGPPLAVRLAPHPLGRCVVLADGLDEEAGGVLRQPPLAQEPVERLDLPLDALWGEVPDQL